MFLLRLVSKTIVAVLFSLITLLLMTDMNIDIPDSALPPSLVKGNYSEYVSNIRGKLSLAHLKEWFGATRANIRPWSEFINTDNFKLPLTLPRMVNRAVNNVSHFQGNYIIIVLILMAYSLLTSPLLLVAMLATYGVGNMLAARAADQKLVLAGKEVTLHQQYLVLGLCSLPVYYWAGVTDLVLWVLGVSCFFTSVHAAFYNIDALLRPEDQLSLVVDEILALETPLA